MDLVGPTSPPLHPPTPPPSKIPWPPLSLFPLKTYFPFNIYTILFSITIFIQTITQIFKNHFSHHPIHYKYQNPYFQIFKKLKKNHPFFKKIRFSHCLPCNSKKKKILEIWGDLVRSCFVSCGDFVCYFTSIQRQKLFLFFSPTNSSSFLFQRIPSKKKKPNFFFFFSSFKDLFFFFFLVKKL